MRKTIIANLSGNHECLVTKSCLTLCHPLNCSQYFGHLVQRTDSFKRPWCCKRLKAGEEGDDKGWDGWMALPTQWTWVWVNSGSWWWTGRPGVLQSMRSQRVRNNWATELNWTELNCSLSDSLSMGFPRQEFWSELQCPPPGIVPIQGLNPGLLHLLCCHADSLPASPAFGTKIYWVTWEADFTRRMLPLLLFG